MQTRKKSSGRTTSREHTSPKVSRAQKKTHEDVKVLDNRVTDMITSSSRKQRLGKLPSYWFKQKFGEKFLHACRFPW